MEYYRSNPILKDFHALFNSQNNPIWSILLLSSFSK